MTANYSAKNILWSANQAGLPGNVWSRLEALGYKILVHDRGAPADDQIAKNSPYLWVKEINGDFSAFLDEWDSVLAREPSLKVILISDQPSVDEAVQAIKAGIHDYLPHGADAERLWATMEAALGSRPLMQKIRPQPGRNETEVYKSPIAVQPAMRRLLELAKKVASSRSTVLIQGESGTGKEVLAHYIHEHGERRSAPFIAVNCAALPENLLESELFGHEKGAFTGAITRKKGKFELAHGGTLLLDEISEIAVAIQAKLLRVLQEREIDRLGGQATLPVDVRVIATTNRDLKAEVQKGRFRSDLFYRLNVIPLSLPPLRKRTEDIVPLACFFLKKHCELNQVEPKTIGAEAEPYLQKREWPGNARELENLMERASLLLDDAVLQTPDLEWLNRSEENGEFLPLVEDNGNPTLHEMEKKMIFQALHEQQGNRTHAAKMLGISVRTLRNKLHEYQGVEHSS